MSLQGKDQLQVLGFVPGVQEAVIADLLETGRKYMHQIPADEFRMLQCDVPARLPWFLAAD